MARKKLTEALAAKATPEVKADGTAQRTRVWDTKQAGLVLQIEPSGAKKFKFYYRSYGRPRWYSIGEYVTARGAYGMSVEAARAEAVELYKATHGLNAVDIQKNKTSTRKAVTVEDLLAKYVEHKRNQGQNKAVGQLERNLRRHALPEFGKRPVPSITRGDVQGVFDKLTAQGKETTANVIVAQLGGLFKYAIQREKVIDTNPAHGLELHKLEDRDRILEEWEALSFWQFVSQPQSTRNQYVQAVAAKFMLLCGQRGKEVRHLRWQDLKQESDGLWWHMQGKRDGQWPGTKNSRPHKVYISAPARELLEQVRGLSDTWVFPNSKGGPTNELSIGMRRWQKWHGFAKGNEVIAHDLRRTHGTCVTRLGFGRDAMNRCQNHLEGGIGSVYDRFEYREESKRVQEAVAQEILRQAGELQDDKVVSFASS